MVTEKKEIILSLHIAHLKTYVVDYFFIVRYCMKVSKTCIEKLRFSLKSCQFHMCLKLEYKIKLSPFSRPVTQSDCLGVCPISFFMSYSKKLPQKEHFIGCLPFDYIIPIYVFCFFFKGIEIADFQKLKPVFTITKYLVHFCRRLCVYTSIFLSWCPLDKSHNS